MKDSRLFSIRLAGAALIAFAQTPHTEAQTAVARVEQNSALELAQILNSEANIVGSDTNDEKTLALIPELFGSKENLAALESAYPGISVEIARATLPRINQSVRARLPELWRRQADLYRASLTPAEIDRLVTFYRSSTGAKMMGSLLRRAKPTAMMADAKKSEDFKINPDSVVKDIRSAAPGILSDMNAEDQAKIVETFGAPGLAAKMGAIAPKTQGTILDWMNESEAGEEDQILKLVTDIIKRRKKEKAEK